MSNTIVVAGPVMVPMEVFESDEAIERLKEELTYLKCYHRRSPVIQRWNAKKECVETVDRRIRAYADNLTHMILPRFAKNWGSRYLPADIKIIHKEFQTSIHPDRFALAGERKPHQMDWGAKILAPLQDSGYITGNAPCGSGKTVCGIWCISKLKPRHTLVVVNSSDLTKQWVEEIKLFLPKMKRRVTRSYDTYQKDPSKWDILVTTVQTLMSRTKPTGPVMSTDFAIFDEVDVYAADKFSAAVMGIRWSKSLGLTATIDRGDGLDKLIYGILGQRFAELQTDNMTPTIVFVPYTMTDAEVEFIMDEDFELKVPKLRLGQYIQQMDARNQFLLKKLEWTIANDYKVLALSHYTDHLKLLAQTWVQRGYTTKIALRHGESSAAELKFAGKDAQLVFGTIGKNKRGLNILHLDCMVQLLPETDPRQPIGRIQRRQPGKRTPLVIDIVDINCPTLVKRAKGRKRRYKQIKAKMIDQTGKIL